MYLYKVRTWSSVLINQMYLFQRCPIKRGSTVLNSDMSGWFCIISRPISFREMWFVNCSWMLDWRMWRWRVGGWDFKVMWLPIAQCKTELPVFWVRNSETAFDIRGNKRHTQTHHVLLVPPHLLLLLSLLSLNLCQPSCPLLLWCFQSLQ